MAHNIELNALRSTHSLFVVKEKAWHGLGQVVNKAQTSAEAIKLANLDFNVSKIPVFGSYTRKDDTIKTLSIPNTYALKRDDNDYILTQNGGLVTEKYKVIQNSEAFNFFDDIAGKGEAIYETAGVLLNGEIIFITAKLPKSCFVNGYDQIDNYLLLTSRHDGLGSIKVKFTPIRVVCNNTLNAALNGGAISIKHTGDINNKLENAKRTLHLINKQQEYVTEIYNKFTNIKLEDKHVQQYLAKCLLNDTDYIMTDNGIILSEDLTTQKLNIMRESIQYYDNGEGQSLASCKGTLFGAYNAITGYLQNVKSEDNDKKLLSYDSGINNRVLTKAFTEALLYL